MVTTQVTEPLSHPGWLTRKRIKESIRVFSVGNTQLVLAGHAGFLGDFLDTAVQIGCNQIQVGCKYGVSKCYLIRCQTNVQMSWTQSFQNKMDAFGPLHDPVTWCQINYAGTQITQWDFETEK